MAQSPVSRSPVRSVLLVASLLGLILTSIFLNRRSAYDVQEASASIYKDRLVPTGMLVKLTSTVYRKRLALEAYVLAANKPNIATIVSTLSQLNRRTDSLLIEFEQTSLTDTEANQLQAFKQRLSVYNQLENELTTTLVDQPAAQQALFAGNGHAAFGQVVQLLDELATLQLSIGEELITELKSRTNYIYVLTGIQIGLVLVVGLSLFWHRF